MKKIMSILLIGFFILAFVSCSSNESQLDVNNLTLDVEADKTEIKEVIRIGATGNYAPLMVTEDGAASGPSIDIITSIFDSLGYEYELVILPWSRLLSSIETGEIDIAFPFYDKPERRKFLYYSEEPIGIGQISGVVMSDSKVNFDGNMTSISGYRIGIVQDYFYSKAFERAIEDKIITVEEGITAEKNIEKLLQGRVDIIFEDITVVKEYIKEHNVESQLKFLETPLAYSYHHIVFSKSKDLSEVRKQVDEQLKMMKSDDTLYNIFSDYDLIYYADLLKMREKMNPSPAKFFQDDFNSPLSVGILGDTKPYAYYENDVLTGFGVEFITEVLTRIGVEFELIDLPFSRMLEELNKGSLDIGTDLYLKPEREAYAHYPELPYAGYPTVLFKKAKTDFDFTGNIEDLKSYSMGYIRGYYLGPLEVYKDNDEYDFSITDSPDQNIENLINDRVDLIIDIKSTGENIIDNLNLEDDIVSVEPPIYYDYSYVVFSKMNNLEKLVVEYELTVEAMFEDGTMEMLSRKYNLPYLEFSEFKK